MGRSWIRLNYLNMASDGDKKRIRDIKIKTGVVKRLGKEKQYYDKEAEREKAKADKMRGDGSDEYQVRKQEEVHAESLMMIPDCIKKLGTAWDGLNNLINTETDLNETEEYKAAQEMLTEWKETARR